MYIPERFIHMVDTHLLGNILDIPDYALILAIIGPPGMGKTYQLRSFLKSVGMEIFSVSAADLESEIAGQPAKLLQQKYLEASAAVSRGQPAVLLIDDIDTTLGEWENHTGTVNHQDILAFLMHIADEPHFIEGVGTVNRIPIFFTGNYFDRLYKPLVREGRARRFEWEPTRQEKIAIISAMFSDMPRETAARLVDAYPGEKLSFFSDLRVSRQVELLARSCGNVVPRRLLTDSAYREQLLAQYHRACRELPWDDILPHTAKEVHST